MSSMPRRVTVADVMTADVHTATLITPFKVLVRLIEENHVAAIPIVHGDRIVVGMVSESDLMVKERRQELESTDDFIHLGRRRRQREIAQGTVAADVMNSPPVTVAAEATLAEAARIMQEKNVHRLIVVDSDGLMVGIVSRSDLLRVYLRTDEELRAAIVGQVIPSALMPGSALPDVDVSLSVVTLSGEVDRKSDVEIMARVIEELDGVVAVVDRLTYRFDDENAAVAAPVAPRETGRVYW